MILLAPYSALSQSPAHSCNMKKKIRFKIERKFIKTFLNSEITFLLTKKKRVKTEQELAEGWRYTPSQANDCLQILPIRSGMAETERRLY